MIDLAQIFALIAILAAAVVYGTDVFCAVVQRPALARVDDQALVAVMGNVHLYGDRRMPVPGVLSVLAAALVPQSRESAAGGSRRSLLPPPSPCC